ncbi:IS66 family transposase [Saccharicrinis sp. 156]|uniref:IS66 family transposase n=1 Tax=Saccharicrinis sp. 156 TaxID=3417574 RepID=UPI003D32D1B3
MSNQQENNDLSIGSLKAKIAILENKLDEKESTIAKQSSEINKLTTDFGAVKFQNEQLRRMIFGSKRERFESEIDSQQLALEFEPKTAEIEETVKAERELIRVAYERKKPKKKHQGRLALPSHLPVVETIIEPPEDTAGMVCIGREITEELDYTPATLHVNRIIRPKYITKEDECGNQKQIIAELNRPIAKCIASTALLAMIFINKYIYHLPLYRTLNQIKRMGVPLPSSTLESWVKLGSQLLLPLYAVHRLYVFREIYQMIDESPIKVQDRGKKGACHQGYMWVRYAPLSKSVLFEYYNSRSTKGPIDDLSTFTGYVQTDGYSGYTYLASLHNITHLSCWAHARRYFEKALANDTERASTVLKLIQLLYAIEALARESGLSPAERHELRLEKSLPIINEIGQYIQEERNKVTPKSPIGKAFEYCANRWISLQNYLTDGILEIDSNLIENSIRPLALGRKNYLFAGSHDAAKHIAMFYSFFGTCSKNNIDPQKWLTYVMANINDTKKSQLKYLLPQFIDENLFG